MGGAGQAGRGDSVSLTITLKAQVAVWPAESVALQVTVFAPGGNAEPDGGEHDTEAAPPLVVGSAKVTTPAHCALTSAGQVIPTDRAEWSTPSPAVFELRAWLLKISHTKMHAATAAAAIRLSPLRLRVTIFPAPTVARTG